MKNKNCQVCGLPTEACLHQVMLKDKMHDRRVSRMLWFSIGFITPLITYLFSCTSTSFTTLYRIENEKTNYYTDDFLIEKDTIYFLEQKRNREFREIKLPVKKSKIVESTRK